MKERIIDWCAQNRFIVILIYVILSGVGIYTLTVLPVDAIPDLSENQVIIWTEYMGRSTEVFEKQVTYPLVTSLQGMPDVKAVIAIYMFGMSFIFAIFEDNPDIYFARTKVLDRLATIKSQLPQGLKPVLGSNGTGVGHVFWCTIESKNHDLGTLKSLQDWYLRYKLFSIEGVAEVTSIGGYIKQFQVDIETRKLRAYNITTSEVIQTIQRSNNEVGGEITNKDIYDSAIESSVLKLRPNLMTILTALIGLMPIMWSTGTGSNVMKPLTTPMIRGLITSAIHVLVVTPILFVIIKERALKKGKLELSKMAGWMKEGE